MHPFDARFDAQENTEGGKRGGVPAGVHIMGETGDVGGFLVDNKHVVNRGTDVFSRNIFPSKGMDESAHGTQQRFCLVGPGLAEDHCLAPSIPDVGDCSLVGHALGEPVGVTERLGKCRVWPHPHTAQCRAECRVMNRDDSLQAAALIVALENCLVTFYWDFYNVHDTLT